MDRVWLLQTLFESGVSWYWKGKKRRILPGKWLGRRLYNRWFHLLPDRHSLRAIIRDSLIREADEWTL